LYVVDWDTQGRTETLEVRDAGTNALLDTRTVSGFTGGQYWRWTVSGHVVVRVVRGAGPNAVVSGVFFDTTTGTPALTQVVPNSGAQGTTNLAVGATGRFTHWVNGTTVASFGTGITVNATTVTDATHLMANVTIASGATVGARTVTATTGGEVATLVNGFTVTPAVGSGPSATFVGTDTTTQGTWRGQYGGDGYVVTGDTTSLPGYATVTPSGQASWTWAGTTGDVRALQTGSGVGRIAATWYGWTFAIDVNLTDGAAHTVGLYVVDWDTQGRTETLEVRDAGTNAVLDTRTVSGFAGGQYWRWTVRGHVVVRVVRGAGPNAVVSGVFFDQ
jgi:hypothetical protein